MVYLTQISYFRQEQNFRDADDDVDANAINDTDAKISKWPKIDAKRLN